MRISDEGMHFDLIQRCTMKEGKNPQGVDALFTFDYMGSSEFEFGALSASMKEIIKRLPEYEFFGAGLTAHGGGKLVYFVLPEKAAEVKQFLQLEAKEPQRLQERTGLRDALTGARGIYKADAWWDIGNNWLAFLGEKNKKRVEQAFRATRVRLAEQLLLKEIQESGALK